MNHVSMDSCDLCFEIRQSVDIGLHQTICNFFLSLQMNYNANGWGNI